MKSSLFKSYTNLVNILIVEDEEKLAQHLKRGLEQEGYMAHYCLSGEQAEDYIYLHSEAIDLIILDWMLPGKNGLEVSKTIRDKNITAPILMLAAKDASEDIIAGLDAGVDDYLTKPFVFKILLARIRALLRRPKATEHIPQEVRIEDLVLNSSRRKVFYKGKEIFLTLKEFNLLEYLIKHPNQVLEREHILEKIWDMNFDSFSNVIDVHIKNIRKKLKEVGDADFLETIRGVGYRIKK